MRVIDLYSVKPLDARHPAPRRRGDAGASSPSRTTAVCGGIGEAVAAAVAGRAPVEILGVREIPRSGKPAELMAAHGLTKDAIIKAVRKAR